MSYQDKITAAPISTFQLAAHRHMLTDIAEITPGLANLAANHADKFDADEQAVLAAALAILARKQVPIALLNVQAETAPLFL